MEPIVAIIENGIVVNCIVADEWEGGVRIEHLDPRPAIGWAYDGETFTGPAVEAPAPEPRIITRLAFLRRITRQEHVAIELASIHRNSASESDQIKAATLRTMLQLVNAASWIDLDEAGTVEMLTALEQVGMLAPGRANEILSGEVRPIETPSSIDKIPQQAEL